MLPEDPEMSSATSLALLWAPRDVPRRGPWEWVEGLEPQKPKVAEIAELAKVSPDHNR